MTATVYPASILSTSEKNAYVPINGEASAEEIGLQSINIEKVGDCGKQQQQQQPENNISNVQLVAKIVMLIGLCKA